MLITSSRKSLAFLFGTIIVCLLFILGIKSVSAETQTLELQDDGVTLEEITNEEAKQNLINISGYSEEEANIAVYGNVLGINNEISAARWSTITHYAPNAKIVGQVKLNNGRIVDAAPQTSVYADSTCDLVKVDYSKLTVKDEYSVRLQSRYNIVCGMFPFWETVDTVKRLR